jgi:hypothetical protein
MAGKRKRKSGQLSGLKQDGTPNAFWRRFKERLNSYETVPLEEWKDEQLLGHILRLYQSRYDLEFTLSYSGPPTKCEEIYFVRRMLYALGAQESPEVAKEYVEWVFDKVVKEGQHIDSIAFFTTRQIVRKFKAQYRKKHRITRSTVLPAEFLQLANDYQVDVNTYGDLAFAKRAVDDSPGQYPNYAVYLTQLEKLGLRLATLDTIGEA